MARPDYSRARWYGAYSGNYGRANRPSSNRIDKVVIHCVNGSWSSAINWFRDPRAGVSAHYTVRSSDGFIGQSVEEKDIGYHAGNWPVNQNSIGIEHEGYGNNPSRWFTPELYNSSARLTAYLCKKYGIPIRRGGVNMSGILAHRQATSTYCPGEFDFDRYIRLVKQYAGSSQEQSPTYRQVVDNSTSGRFSASSDWGTSSFSSQRWGADYRFTRPADVADNAWYRINIPSRGKYAIFARWPADPGYNNRTRFMIRTAGGWKTRVVNQRLDGGRWVRLGVFDMAAGDQWNIAIPRRTSGTGLIIADAVLVRA